MLGVLGRAGKVQNIIFFSKFLEKYIFNYLYLFIQYIFFCNLIIFVFQSVIAFFYKTFICLNLNFDTKVLAHEPWKITTADQ